MFLMLFLLALEYVARYYVLQLLGLRFAALGISIAGEVHQVPLVVDAVVVYEQCFARWGRCHCQFLLVGEAVYEARFAHIGASDEGIFGLAVLWAFLYIGVAYYKLCCFYNWCAHSCLYFCFLPRRY